MSIVELNNNHNQNSMTKYPHQTVIINGDDYHYSETNSNSSNSSSNSSIDENLNFSSNIGKKKQKQIRKSLSSSLSSSHQNQKNSYRLNSMLKSIANNDNENYWPNDNDLTNLNWLQDGDLLKKVYETNDVDSDTDRKQQQRSVAFRRPPLSSLRTTISHQNQLKMKKYEKPPYSYSALIYMALESSPTKSMVVSDIYKWIINHYPYYSTASPGWKNTIRHTLSLRKCFKKIESNYNKKYTNSDIETNKTNDIKKGYWYVDPEYRCIFQKQIFTLLPDNNHYNHKIKNNQIYQHDLHHANRNGCGCGGVETIRTSIINRTRAQTLRLKKLTSSSSSTINIKNGQHHQQSSIISANLIPILEPHKYGNRHHNQATLATMNGSKTLIKINSNNNSNYNNNHNNFNNYYLLNPNSLSLDDNNIINGNIVVGNAGGSICGGGVFPNGTNNNIYRNLVTVISVNQAPKLYAPVPIISTATTTTSTMAASKIEKNINCNFNINNNNNNNQLSCNGNMQKMNKNNNNGQPQQLEQPQKLPSQQQKERKNHLNLLKDRKNVCLNCDQHQHHWNNNNNPNVHHLATGGFILPAPITKHLTLLTTTVPQPIPNNVIVKQYNAQQQQFHEVFNNGAQRKFIKFNNNDGNSCCDGDDGNNKGDDDGGQVENNNKFTNNNKNFVWKKNGSSNLIAIKQQIQQQPPPSSSQLAQLPTIIENKKRVTMITKNNKNMDTKTTTTIMNNNNNNDNDDNNQDKLSTPIDIKMIDDGDDDDDVMLKDGAQALLNFASKSFLFNFVN